MLLPKIPDSLKNLVVIGDIMLDKWINGEVKRISPEAPVPILEINKEEIVLGGAGNVANNAASLGINTYLLGTSGNDKLGDEMRRLCSLKRINFCIPQDSSRKTTIKTRICAGNHHIVRIDSESKDKISHGTVLKLIEYFNTIPNIGAVIFADYNKGVVTQGLFSTIVNLCNLKDIPVIVDPKPSNKISYFNATILKPNLKEAKELCPELNTNNANLLAEALVKKFNLKAAVITMGDKGALFFASSSKYCVFENKVVEIFDVSGAGDTFSAAFTTALIWGLDYYGATEIANLAAGLVISKPGTSTISVKELIDYIKCQRIT
jgi:rfaE bifunctional protein kinase chain/domain